VAVATGGSGLAAAAQFQSPEAATVSWFYAINHRDKAAAVAHFTPAAARMANWYGTWPSFAALRCHPTGLAGAAATVYCSFSETPGADGNIDTFWTVDLRHQPDGRWLIDNYGQG
jgi:hypothetical protein